ncbi:MAG: hypothetical protein RR359_05710 [Bacilli bacterium]
MNNFRGYPNLKIEENLNKDFGFACCFDLHDTFDQNIKVKFTLFINYLLYLKVKKKEAVEDSDIKDFFSLNEKLDFLSLFLDTNHFYLNSTFYKYCNRIWGDKFHEFLTSKTYNTFLDSKNFMIYVSPEDRKIIKNIIEDFLELAIKYLGKINNFDKETSYNLIKQYKHLLDIYINRYNVMNEREKKDVIANDYNYIYEMESPSFELEKRAALCCANPNNVTDMHFKYADEKFERHLRKKFPNITTYYDMFSKPIIDTTLYENNIIEILDEDPICSLCIINIPCTKKIINKVLDVFPDILYCGNWEINKGHLLFNDRVYSIMENNNKRFYPYNSTILKDVLQENLDIIKSVEKPTEAEILFMNMHFSLSIKMLLSLNNYPKRLVKNNVLLEFMNNN